MILAYLTFWLQIPSQGTVVRDLQQFHLRELSVDEGLSQSSVVGFCEDRFGFMWLATMDGLNRFDGRDFVTLESIEGDATSLPASYCTSLLAAPNGTLWVGTGKNGVGIVDPVSMTCIGSVLTYTGRDSSHRVWALAFGQGFGWIGTENGLYRCDLEGKNPSPVPVSNVQKLARSVVALQIDQQEQVWVAYREGQIGVVASDGLQCRVQLDLNAIVVDLEMDRNGLLWISTESEGIAIWDPKGLPPVWVGGSEGLICERGEHLFLDRSGNMWIGTMSQGFSRWDPEAGIMQWFQKDRNIRISVGGATNFYQDRHGLMWIGTHGGGAYVWDPKQEEFGHYASIADDARGIRSNIVNEFNEDPDGNVWIGTQSGGLHCVNSNQEVISHYGSDETLSQHFLPSTHVAKTYFDRDGVLWVGSREGGVYKRVAGHFEAAEYATHPERLESPNVISLFMEDAYGFWIGTSGCGANYLNHKTGQTLFLRENSPCDLQLTHNKVWCGTIDRSGRIWLGTFDGLNLVASDRTSIRHVQADDGVLSDDMILGLYRDHQDRIWIGTAGGLDLVDPDWDGTRPPRRSWTQDTGLLNDMIYGVVEDGLGYLWGSSNRGLFRIDLANYNLEVFSTRCGLQGDEFNSGAILRARDGRLYFGGVTGYNVFDPSQIEAQAFRPDLRLKEARTLNGERAGDFTSADQLNLKHEDGLVVEFASLNFAHSDGVRFAYRIRELSEQWVDNGLQNRINFASLPTGTISLEIRAIDDAGRKGDRDLSLSINVATPYWMTTWFRILAAIGLVALANLVYVWGRRIARALVFWRKSKLFGPFQVHGEVGRGGMATIFRAYDSAEGRLVALKVLESAEFNQSKFKRFLQEAMIGEFLNHANVVRVFAKGCHEGRYYCAMEYVDGSTLRTLIEKRAISPLGSLLVARVLIDVLDHIHSRNIVHRDLKPENIMIDRHLDFDSVLSSDDLEHVRSHVKLLDFGLAKVFGNESITHTGVLAGTLAYLPPEYIQGTETVDASLDYYAVGMILYECLTGVNPYFGDGYLQVLQSVLHGSVQPPHLCDDSLHEALSDLTMDLIAKDPTERLRDYVAIRMRLDKAIEDLERPMAEADASRR